jgi:transposase
MELHTIGIDLGKTVFHLVGLNQRGEVVVRKKFSRKQLLHFTANLQVKLIGMEACGGSHFLGRALREQGHEVRLMPAQYVKPYVKTNKSDYIDAEAIAEAVGRPKMRFVPIKSDDQLDLQSLHRVRERWVMRRTAVINQIRGLLLERGITLRQGRRHIDAALPGILEDASAQLSGALRVAAGTTEAGARSLANADRRSRCGDSEDCWRERSLPTASSDPWHRTCDGDRNHRRDRQWSSFQKRARVFRVARNRPGRIHHWRQAKAAGD